MTEQQNSTLNELALKYAQTQDGYVLTDLINLLKPVIQRDALKWGRMYQKGDWADFESEFYQAAHHAAKWYDGRSDFIQSFHYWAARYGSKWVRKMRAKKRGIDLECESLHQVTGYTDNGESVTLFDQISSSEQTEETVILKEMTANFGESNGQYAEIIQLSLLGASNQEIARSLGASRYNSFARKKVERAKKAFKEHITLTA